MWSALLCLVSSLFHDAWLSCVPFLVFISLLQLRLLEDHHRVIFCGLVFLNCLLLLSQDLYISLPQALFSSGREQIKRTPGTNTTTPERKHTPLASNLKNSKGMERHERFSVGWNHRSAKKTSLLKLPILHAKFPDTSRQLAQWHHTYHAQRVCLVIGVFRASCLLLQDQEMPLNGNFFID